jgi:ParB family chromosome partitioning protein
MGRRGAGRKPKTLKQIRDPRRDEQIQALRLVQERGMTSTRAAERVIAEREARAQAAQWAVPVVDDPRAELGERFYEFRVPSYDGSANLIGTIDPGLGTLVVYARPRVVVDTPSPPHPAGQDGPPSDESPGKNIPPAGGTTSNGDAQRGPGGAAAARAHRRQACVALIAQQVSNSDLLRILVGQYLSGVAARAASSAVPRLLRDWDADMEGNSEKARASRVWHRAIAAAELHTSDLADKPWDDTAAAHLQLLIDRVGYQPTPWEQDQLDATRR